MRAGLRSYEESLYGLTDFRNWKRRSTLLGNTLDCIDYVTGIGNAIQVTGH